MPSADPIRELVDRLRSVQPRAKIEHQVDPLQQNRIGYRITGPTRDCVQVVVNNLVASVGDGFGCARFEGPFRCDLGYIALGEVVVGAAPIMERAS